MANKRKLTQEQIDSIARRHANGQSDKEIAAEFGVSSMTIYRYRNRAYYEKHQQAAREYQREKLGRVQQQRKTSHEIFTFAFHKEKSKLGLSLIKNLHSSVS